MTMQGWKNDIRCVSTLRESEVYVSGDGSSGITDISEDQNLENQKPHVV